ncbi:MAG: exo-alpha-sialidase [Thiotrichales bacterium]|nr:exo-alpha-sialidase [Thiotrichales bacterium]
MPEMSPEAIANAMDGKLRQTVPGRFEALLPSPSVQNHAAFLSAVPEGLHCLWFGGSLEGKSDISIWRSTLSNGTWSFAERLTEDPDRSEQNPVEFHAPDGRTLLFHTAQPGGNQDACVVRVREDGGAPRDLSLPPGTFIRSPIQICGDGAWLMGLFRCVSRPGERWTGAHDTAALAISEDEGTTWREVDLLGSEGCVHMTPVFTGPDSYAAFFRRRQADFVYRTESEDGGESWSTPVATDVPNNNSSISVIRLIDGRFAMACNPTNAVAHPEARRASLYDELGDGDDRPNAAGGCNPVWGVPRAPMTLCISEDDGHSFPKRIVIEDGPGTCLANNSEDGSNKEMSYPALLQRDDGTLDLAYTYHRRAIKHVRLDPVWLKEHT